jgi:hypothetical protein
MTEIVAESMQLGPRSANLPTGQAGAPHQTNAPVADIRRPAPVARPVSTSAEPEIPVINEDELTVASIDEEPKPIKDTDLPF